MTCTGQPIGMKPDMSRVCAPTWQCRHAVVSGLCVQQRCVWLSQVVALSILFTDAQCRSRTVAWPCGMQLNASSVCSRGTYARVNRHRSVGTDGCLAQHMPTYMRVRRGCMLGQSTTRRVPSTPPRASCWLEGENAMHLTSSLMSDARRFASSSVSGMRRGACAQLSACREIRHCGHFKSCPIGHASKWVSEMPKHSRQQG